MDKVYEMPLPLPDTLCTEVAFLVMSNRLHGELPTTEKSTEQIFHIFEDAEKEFNRLTTVAGHYYGIYRVAIIVESRIK